MKSYKVEFVYDEHTYGKDRDFYKRELNLDALGEDLTLNEFELSHIKNNKKIALGETFYYITDIIFKLTEEKSIIFIVKNIGDDDLPF